MRLVRQAGRQRGLKASHLKRGDRPVQAVLEEESDGGMASKGIRTMTGRLLEAVAHPDNLLHAFKRVKANKGAPGIDGMTVEELGLWLDHNLEELHKLLSLSDLYSRLSA